MSSINFQSGTIIPASWLNDVNSAVYGGGSTPGLNASNVTYQPAGTGAVTTTVQAKLQETPSVLDFGAGVSKTAAINASAFLAAWTANNPKAVLVPAGTYQFTGTVTGKFFSFGAVTISGGTVSSITNLVP